MKKTILLLLSALMLLNSCSMYMHPGITSVARPALTDNDQSKWVTYYQDQFDGDRGNVLEPASDYPDAARQAYQQVHAEFMKKFKNHQVALGFGVVGGILLTVIIIIAAVSSSTP